MREEVPTPDNTLKPPAVVRYKPYSPDYSEIERPVRKRTNRTATKSKKRAARKQERQNRKAGR